MKRPALMFFALVVVLLAACTVQAPEPQPTAPQPVSKTTKMTPSDGWTLHIDAKKHFGDDSASIAHHYCKPVADSVTECQLYDGDREDSKLVGVETIVGPDVYQTFSDEEKKLWHYHKDEIPKVDAKLPDMTPEEAAVVVKSIEETYGKVWILWDPATSKYPVGQPSVTILD